MSCERPRRSLAGQHYMCHFHECAISAPAKGPLRHLNFARHWQFPYINLQAQKCHIYGSGTFRSPGELAEARALGLVVGRAAGGEVAQLPLRLLGWTLGLLSAY